jgi:hypothetical protein
MTLNAGYRRIIRLLLALLLVAGTACSDDPETNNSRNDVGADTAADAGDAADHDGETADAADTNSDASDGGNDADVPDGGVDADITDAGTDTNIGFATGQACPSECEMEFAASMICETCDGNWCFSPDDTNQAQDYCTMICSNDSECEQFGNNWVCGGFSVCERR